MLKEYALGLLALLLLAALVVADEKPGQTVVKPVDNQAELRNPGMGFVLYFYNNGRNTYGSKLAASDLLEDWPGLTTVYMRLPWSDLEPEEGVYDWNLVDFPLRRFAQAGLLGTTDEVSDITLSAWFAARDLNVANGIPASMTFSLLLLTGTPDSFEVLATSGPLTHSPVKTWVQHSVTAFGVAAGTPVYAGLQANYYMDDPVVLTVVDDVQVSTVVPEPGTVGLLALGVATIACGRRRR